MSKKSFTLVEIILALAILGVGMVSILTVFFTAAANVSHSVAITEASFIAQMLMEDCRLQGYNNLSLGSTALPPEISNYYSGYSGTMNITDVAGPPPGLRRIDVTVARGTKTIGTFSTYIAQ